MSQFHKGSRWYAVQTRSRFEKRVTTDLSSKGVESYCPAIAEVHQWADRKKIVDQPVFPGYVFAKFQDSGPLRLSVLQTPGAVRILGDARTIEPIPDEEIELIRS